MPDFRRRTSMTATVDNIGGVAGRAARAPESTTQDQILAALHDRGIFAWRQNTGGAKVKGAFVRFGIPGTPDIIAVLPPSGVVLWIEVKGALGRQTDAQKLFQSRIEQAGGRYVLARSVADVLERIDR